MALNSDLKKKKTLLTWSLCSRRGKEKMHTYLCQMEKNYSEEESGWSRKDAVRGRRVSGDGREVRDNGMDMQGRAETGVGGGRRGLRPREAQLATGFDFE